MVIYPKLGIVLLATFIALGGDPIRPAPSLTPGAVLTTDLAIICRPGCTKTVRHTSGKLKRAIYREYGIRPKAGHYEIDHLIPLELGGADVRANLWPESYDTEAGVEFIPENGGGPGVRLAKKRRR